MLRNSGFVPRLDHLIGMHDLAHLSIEIEAARHAALFAAREKLARQPRRPPEIDEPDMIARLVERFDPGRPARRATRTGNRLGVLHEDCSSGLPLSHTLPREPRKPRTAVRSG